VPDGIVSRAQSVVDIGFIGYEAEIFAASLFAGKRSAP